MNHREKIINSKLRSLVAVVLILFGPWLSPPFVKGADTVLYYHNDALGSPVAMTNSGGTVIWNIDYGSFGDEVNLTESPNLPNSHRFVGKETDVETGLHNLGTRYYDPGIGRFLSVDPALFHGRPYSALRIPQRLNFYSYATDNPYRFVDPDGKFIQVIPILLAVGGAFLTTAMLPSTANSPTLYDQNLIPAQTTTDFAEQVIIGETIGFGLGKGITKFAGKITGRHIINTPYGPAYQSTSIEALQVREAVENGATLYKGGKLEISHGVESQFWALENPLNPNFGNRFNIPKENTPFDFFQSGTLKPGAEFITREVEGGAGIEIVVNPNSVNLKSFTMP